MVRRSVAQAIIDEVPWILHYVVQDLRSGSYLLTSTGLRRFAPREIVRLLGFPPSFRLPGDLPAQPAWRHVGNSLSVAAVRHVLSAIPALAQD